jgi:hypothetical protein
MRPDNAKLDVRGTRVVLAAIVLAIVAAFWSFAQVPTPNRPLAQWMPSGAVFYLESSDFATQLRDWNRSGVKAKWLASKNHEEFMTTRLVLKLKEVYAEFANAAGFDPDLDALETVAGTDSALAVYDIRRLDLVYISHLPSARLSENVLTRVRSGYQTRTAAGQSYFARQGGSRTAAFAIAGEYVIASTREDLLAAALELIQGNTTRASISQDSWYQDALRAMPGDAAKPELRLVMDFANAIKTPYFRSYWIQKNGDSLRQYYAFLAQLNRKADALEETRVLLRSEAAPVLSHEAATMDLQRYAPDGVGLFRVWDAPSTGFAIDLIRQKLFAGAAASVTRRYAPQTSLDQPAGSVFDLQTRIDAAPKPSLAGALELEPLKAAVDSAGLEGVLQLESSLPIDASTFVRSDAAIALRAASAWNADAIRSALISAVASYQSVGNIGLQWRNVSAGGATLSQWNGLLPLTMYADGQTLWIARSPSLIGAALDHARSAAPAATAGAYIARYNHGAELPAYLRLMRMLDLSDQSNYSSFFSENIGSLASALDTIDSVSVAVHESELVERQSVTYRLAR